MPDDVKKGAGKRAYQVGDACWIHLGAGEENGLVRGEVVHAFMLPDWPDEQYVVEVPTAIDPLLEVRNALAMSQDAMGPILLFRNLPAIVAAAREKLQAQKKQRKHDRQEEGK